MLLATLSTASLLMDPIHPHAPSQQAEACVVMLSVPIARIIYMR